MQLQKQLKLMHLFIFLIAVILTTGCEDEKKEYENMSKLREKHLVKEFAELNNLRQIDKFEVYYTSIKEGTGKQIEDNNEVTFNYTCSLIDGTIVKNSENDEYIKNISTYLSQGIIIQGLELAIKQMKAGGIAKIIIPSSLGYENKLPYHIPYTNIYTLSKKIKNESYYTNKFSNIPLVFDIEIISVR